MNLICFILVRHTNNITSDKTIPSSVTIEAFTTSLLSTLTCFRPYIFVIYIVYLCILKIKTLNVIVVSKSIDVPSDDGL
jgi:hypothetical protein